MIKRIGYELNLDGIEAMPSGRFNVKVLIIRTWLPADGMILADFSATSGNS